jgi:hypothetical protein
MQLRAGTHSAPHPVCTTLGWGGPAPLECRATKPNTCQLHRLPKAEGASYYAQRTLHWHPNAKERGIYYTHTDPSIPIPKGTKSQLIRTEPSQPAITVEHQNQGSKSQPHRTFLQNALGSAWTVAQVIVNGSIYAPPRALQAGPQGCFNSTPRALQAGPQGGYTTPYTSIGPAGWAATTNLGYCQTNEIRLTAPLCCRS